jgi:adenosylcobinamide hydrolase
MFHYARTDDRLTLRREGTRWLSNGFDGGYREADAAHNLTVPEGFDRTDLAAYAAERLGTRPPGPTLLTGVEQRHARGARSGPVEVVATAGLSNPAILRVDGDGESHGRGTTQRDGDRREDRIPPETGGDEQPEGKRGYRPGTVNLFVGTTRALDDGALAALLATAVEAKTATLLAVASATGTTSDAIVVGCDPGGEGSRFAGSATAVGRAARACVRDAVLGSLDARYDGVAGPGGPPEPADARYGVVTDGETTAFEP